MHRQVVVLEHNKNNLESRQDMNQQKIDQYFDKIKMLQEQKRKVS